MKPSDCPLIGTWQIVEADIWDTDHLDLCGPAKIVLGAKGAGEIAFGATAKSRSAHWMPTSICNMRHRPSSSDGTVPMT